jgi:hypothetical protein
MRRGQSKLYNGPEAALGLCMQLVWRGRKSEKDERLRNVGPENKKRGLVQAPFLN